jgi:hypothetical protein
MRPNKRDSQVQDAQNAIYWGIYCWNHRPGWEQDQVDSCNWDRKRLYPSLNASGLFQTNIRIRYILGSRVWLKSSTFHSDGFVYT